MRNFKVCRRCEILEHHTSERGLNNSNEKRSFVVSGSRPHYAPDRPFRLGHILVKVELDPRKPEVRGHVVQNLEVVSPGQTQIVLDQIGIQIRSAQINEQEVPFTVSSGKLVLELNAPPKVGATLVVAVQYEVHRPQRGIYFTGPDADYPSKRYQVWSQGQDEDNRHWIPLLDYPNQKATTEVIATVPKGFTAVSNGALVSRKVSGDQETFHYRLGTPHVTYLISLVVAEFSSWQDEGPRGLPVQYFSEPGKEADAKRAFQNTPQMIEVYEKMTGVPFAYEKYSQVAVQDFIFGGMENTSATTQTDRVLHDERAALDFSGDPLVSHELAHQWFGDLVTCRDWSHGWLNEGFATFMERVWIENNLYAYKTKEKALEEARYYALADLREYLEEDATKYRRPIVCNQYIEPIDLFDAHLYQKGGLVLNLIRNQVGEDGFWKSIKNYLERHRGGSVETLDLIRAIEETTGRNLRKLFDQWIFSAGYPEFECTYAWDSARKVVELVVEQKQTAGRNEAGAGTTRTSVFELDVCVQLWWGNGQSKVEKLSLREPRERWILDCETAPLAIRFDPGNTIPKTLKFSRPVEMLIYQLHHDEDCTGRIEAAYELAKIQDTKVVLELSRALKQDAFWGAQGEIALALSQIRRADARAALVDALGVSSSKARKMVVKALSAFKNAEVTQALRKLAEEDPSYWVEAEAISSWAASRQRIGQSSASPEVSETESFLLDALAKNSYAEVIRISVFRALAELPGVSQGERPRALDALIDWTKRGGDEDARMGAVMALGTVARSARPAEKERILHVFSQLADEDSFRIRMRLIAAILESGLMEASGILEKMKTLDLDGRVRRGCSFVKDALAWGGGSAMQLQALKEQFEKLDEEQKRLRGLVEELKHEFQKSRGT